MLTLFVIVPVILLFVVARVVMRLLAVPFRMGRRQPYGYGFGRRHPRHGWGGGLLTVAALFALDRMFGRRW